jgi:hypothetical protein
MSERQWELMSKAAMLAMKCGNAYSAFAYDSWPNVAKVLLARGLTEQEAEAVMVSKWTRWAVDQSPARYGRVPAKAIIKFLDGMKNERAEIKTLVREMRV